MRITGGEWKGRRLTPPADGRVRPTGERVREAWMSILGAELKGARVLDLYAGSGALGLEALSRGAEHVTFVEMAPASLAALRANIEALGASSRVTVRRADARRFVERLEPGAYDLVFADPPWSLALDAPLVSRFRKVPFARWLVVEHPSATHLEGDDTRRYGDTALTFVQAP
ncbi:MAG: 16S rRNA (guanine(966)-N(2))-methyltransferase RsmD [Gemmatimonadales bacterium]